MLIEQHADQQRQRVRLQQRVGRGILNELQGRHLASLGPVNMREAPEAAERCPHTCSTLDA